MTEAELPMLHCSVTLLSDFEAAAAWDDWQVKLERQPNGCVRSHFICGGLQVGVHGISIEFRDQANNAFGATYLPSVAAEQGADATPPSTHACTLSSHKLTAKPTERKNGAAHLPVAGRQIALIVWRSCALDSMQDGTTSSAWTRSSAKRGIKHSSRPSSDSTCT